MAFDDLPQIDPPSEHDDEAKNRLAAIFSQKAGFISREQVPDKGNDYLVELIEHRSAKNRHFCLQLKSVENPVLIDEGSTISFSWLTSRMGYIMRNEPIYGILVIYDVSSGKLYYEYVYELYQKLMERETDGWKANQYVNVHVPVANVLDSGAASKIHLKYLRQFNNLSKMVADHGASYNLPVVKMGQVGEWDTGSTSGIVEILQRFDLQPIEVNDLPIIHELITRLPSSEILQHKALCIQAALAYSEVGRIADSDFYLQRLCRRFALEHGEELTVSFIQLKNDYSLGLVDIDGFVATSRMLLDKTDDPYNRLILRLNILNFELMGIRSLMDVPEAMAIEIGELASSIEALEESPRKYYLKLWNLENLVLFISVVRVNGFNEMKILEQFGRTFTLEERLGMAQKLVGMQGLFNKEMKSVEDYAKNTESKLLRAYAILASTRSKLSLEIDLLISSDIPPDVAEHEKMLAYEVNVTQQGVDIFFEYKLMAPAYGLMCMAAELHTITTDWYGLRSVVNYDKLQEGLRYFERELELPVFVSAAKKQIERQKEKREVKESGNQDHKMRFLSGLEDKQLENLAATMILSGRFPNGKKEYLLKEMKSFKLFYLRCTDADVHIMVKQLPQELVYSIPPSFQLRNSRSGIVSVASADMESLLNGWGF